MHNHLPPQQRRENFLTPHNRTNVSSIISSGLFPPILCKASADFVARIHNSPRDSIPVSISFKTVEILCVQPLIRALSYDPGGVLLSIFRLVGSSRGVENFDDFCFANTGVHAPLYVNIFFAWNRMKFFFP